MIGEDIWRWQLLGPMLDLAGHSLRKGKLRAHPLAGQRARLRELLSGTVKAALVAVNYVNAFFGIFFYVLFHVIPKAR